MHNNISINNSSQTLKPCETQNSELNAQSSNQNSWNTTLKIPKEFTSTAIEHRHAQTVGPNTNSKDSDSEYCSYKIIEEYKYKPPTGQNKETFTIQKISTPKLPGTHSKDESSTPSNGPQVLYLVSAEEFTTTFVDPNYAKQHIDELAGFKYQDKSAKIMELIPDLTNTNHISVLGGIAAGYPNMPQFTIGNQEKWEQQVSSASNNITHPEYQDCQTPDKLKVESLKILKQYSKCINECLQGTQNAPELKTQKSKTQIFNILTKIWNALVKLINFEGFFQKNIQKQLSEIIETIQSILEEFQKSTNDDTVKSETGIQRNNLQEEVNSNYTTTAGENIETQYNAAIADNFYSILPNKIKEIISSRENKIITLERNIGGNNMVSGGRTFSGLMDGLAPVFTGYFKSSEGNIESDAELMHSFASKYGEDALYKAIKTAIITAGSHKDQLVEAYKRYYEKYRADETCPKLQILNDDLQELCGKYNLITQQLDQISKETNTEEVAALEGQKTALENTKTELEKEFENYKKQNAKTDNTTWELDIGDLTIMVNPRQANDISLRAISTYYVEQQDDQ